MKSSLNHIQININYENILFYKDLMTFLGWSVIHDGEGIIGYMGQGEASIWFLKAQKDGQSDYDNPGVNHIGIKVESQKDVDDAAAYLQTKNTEALFGTPRHRAEFAMSEKETYYQVMFESPDHILFEVVYTGAKN